MHKDVEGFTSVTPPHRDQRRRRCRSVDRDCVVGIARDAVVYVSDRRSFETSVSVNCQLLQAGYVHVHAECDMYMTLHALMVE